MAFRLFVFPFIICAALSACSSTPGDLSSGPDYQVSGPPATDGQPTVVMEAGLGDGRETWTALLTKLSVDHQVFTWSRAGYGSSSESWASDQDGIRSGPEIAQHLNATLALAGIKPPYVLVGHSIGGAYALSYAKQWPEKIAGIVLVDARLPGFTEACKAAGLDDCEIPDSILALLPPNQQAELRGLAETQTAILDTHTFDRFPVTVMAAENGAPGLSPENHALWLRFAHNYSSGLAHGRYVFVAGSGHYIHHDQPDHVANEIRALLQKP
jgi:pimeloyl-ACP methyl ester carboxylesterase